MTKPKSVIVRVDIRTGAVIESKLEQMYWLHYWTRQHYDSLPTVVAGKEAKRLYGDG